MPTLGILFLVLAVAGLGLVPVIAALVALAVPPILTTTYAGIRAVDPAVVDAARGIGLRERQIVTQVELPVALPIILGGLRNATLQVVATATIGAYVGQGGLGTYLFSGLALRDYPRVVAGSVLVAVLAVLLDLLWSALQRVLVSPAPTVARPVSRPAPCSSPCRGGSPRPGRLAGPRRRRRLIHLALSAIPTREVTNHASYHPHHHPARREPAARRGRPDRLRLRRQRLRRRGDPLSGGGGDGDAGTITVGSANFPENELLMQMYGPALEDAGVEVQYQPNIGAREVYLEAFENGEIDLLPEYNGALLSYLLAPDLVPEDVTDSEQVYEALQDVLPEGSETLPQSEAEDKDTLTVTQETAEEFRPRVHRRPRAGRRPARRGRRARVRGALPGPRRPAGGLRGRVSRASARSTPAVR